MPNSLQQTSMTLESLQRTDVVPNKHDEFTLQNWMPVQYHTKGSLLLAAKGSSTSFHSQELRFTFPLSKESHQKLNVYVCTSNQTYFMEE